MINKLKKIYFNNLFHSIYIKRLILFSAILFNSLLIRGQVEFCDSALIDEVSNYRMKDGAVFMREYTVMLDSIGADSIIPEQKYSIVLLANIVYRFVIKGYSKCHCEPKLTIENMHKAPLISSNYQKGKKPEQFDIKIKETGAHSLNIHFRDGRKGCAVVAMFYVKNTTLIK